MKPMQRIIVIGATGSGKTTLAAKIAARLGCPCVDMDDLRFLPGWVERPDAAFVEDVLAATAGPSFVTSGDYFKLLHDTLWPRADTVIWLDYPFPRVFWQLLKRTLHRTIFRVPVCNGNYERASLLFSKKGIMYWLLNSYWRKRRRYAEIFGGAGLYPHHAYIRLTSPRDTQRWLETL